MKLNIKTIIKLANPRLKYLRAGWQGTHGVDPLWEMIWYTLKLVHLHFWAILIFAFAMWGVVNTGIPSGRGILTVVTIVLFNGMRLHLRHHRMLVKCDREKYPVFEQDVAVVAKVLGSSKGYEDGMVFHLFGEKDSSLPPNYVCDPFNAKILAFAEEVVAYELKKSERSRFSADSLKQSVKEWTEVGHRLQLVTRTIQEVYAEASKNVKVKYPDNK